MNLNEISTNLQSGNARETSALVNKAIAEHYDFETIIKDGFIPGIRAVQERYQRNEILVPEIRMATRALDYGLRQIKMAIASSGEGTKGTVVIGTAYTDPEDTETNIIAVTMEGRGLRVIDLGASVAPEQFIEAAIEEDAGLIVCAAALVTTMAQMKTLVQAASAAGIREQVKIMLIGAPVTERYCSLIGADIYAHDAITAAEMASTLYDHRLPTN
jgi:methanogenic corrinoid protein MtbC1